MHCDATHHTTRERGPGFRLAITNQPEERRDGNYTKLGESRYSEIDTLKFVQ